MKRLFLMGLFAAVVAGCSPRGPQLLGTSFEGNTVPIAAALETNGSAALVVQGDMTEKCPVAGCWFILQDPSGQLKVDTKNAGFVVVNVPLKSRVTVAGRVTTNGSERLMEATGLRF
jgi:uncharacterized protein YdeI (BOF family)